MNLGIFPYKFATTMQTLWETVYPEATLKGVNSCTDVSTVIMASEVSRKCMNINPDGSLTGGSGSGSDGGSAASHLALAPVESINLKERLQCFQPIATNTKYKVTIHVHAAHQGYPTQEYWDRDPGHAYITMEKISGSTTTRLSFGFYPREDTWVTPTKNAVSSGIGEESANGKKNSDIRYAVQIGSSEFTDLSIQARSSAEKFYELNDCNCTDLAIEVFNSAVSSGKKLTVPDSNIGFTTPAGLYKTLANKQGVAGIEESSIKAPRSTNCD